MNRLVNAVAGQEGFKGSVAGSYGKAISMAAFGPPKALIIGAADATDTRDMHKAALGAYRLGSLIEVMTPEAAKETDYPPSDDGAAIVYVCTSANCAPPTPDKAKMLDLLKNFGKTAGAAPPSADPPASDE
jgi:uncharacterized protein YyaL (SSP411 family)